MASWATAYNMRLYYPLMLSRLKTVITIFSVLTFIGLLSSHTAGSETKKPGVSKAIIENSEIIKFLEAFSAAYKKGNADEYMTFYTPAVMKNRANTFDKIKANYLDTIAHNIITVYMLEISDIKNLGDYAILDALYNKTLIEKSKGSTFITSGNVRIKVEKNNDYLKIVTVDYDKYIRNEYIIGAEDVVEVSVWKSPDLSTTVIVRPDGMISIPLIGDIRASNRTAKELKEEIEQGLTEYKQDPIVSIIVREVNSKAIYVTGEVVRPGKFPLRSEATIIQAITMAGGFTQWANKDKIVVIRKSPMFPEGNRLTIKYSDIVSGANMKANITLKAGDTVIVP